MANRIGLLCFLALGACVIGCGGPAPTPTEDAGRDAGGGGVDAASDVDGGTVDGGGPIDSGTSDAFTPADANADVFVPGGGTLTLAADCPDFTPCGGSIVGSWQYDSICIEHAEIIGQFPAFCQTGTVIEEGSGTVDGTVTATATSITRTIDTSTSATILVNATCSALGCDTLQTMVESMIPGATATCTPAGTTPAQCRCMATFPTSIDETMDYTISGDTITMAGGRTFDFCVDDVAGTLQYRESGADPVEPGVSLSRSVD